MNIQDHIDEYVEGLEEENAALKVRIAELERQQPRPLPDPWMYNCKAFKCGCDGNPQWHADKVAGERRRQQLARESRNKGNTRPPPCSSESHAQSRRPSPYDPAGMKRERDKR